MSTAKHSFSQETTTHKTATEHVSVSSNSTDIGYQRLELLLIGFASVFITFLWVGVFSAVVQNRSVRIPFSGTGTVAAITRNIADQGAMTARGMLDGGIMAKDTIVYQFIAIWESSCVTQQTCVGGLQTISLDASGAVAIVNNIVSNSELFVSVVRDVSSFRLGETGMRIAQLVSPGRAYASDVLGKKIVAPGEILREGMTEYYQYVDSMTFGAISAINPDLIESHPDSVQN